MNSILNTLYGALLVLPLAGIGAVIFGLIGLAVGAAVGHWQFGGVLGACVGAVLTGGFGLVFILNYASPQ